MTHPHPQTISARLDPSILDRVTRMYSAGADDVLGELLQNARRAGAAAVHVDLQGDASRQAPHHGPTSVVVTDDGCGIADPTVILAYGRNGWDPHLTRREDAAGIGLAALAGLGCSLTSWTAGSDPAWETRLEPCHFEGRQPAPIRQAPRPRQASGTRIAFRIQASAAHILKTAQHLLRYYPIAAVLTLNGQTQELHQIPYVPPGSITAHVLGATLAVPPRGHAAPCGRPHDTSFHGHLLRTNLPTLQDAWGQSFQSLADIHDCLDFRLVLPARKEAVNNTTLKTLRDEARKLLLRAVSEDPDADLTHANYLEARAFMEPTPARPRLRPWQPYSPEDDDRPLPALETLKPTALIDNREDETAAADHALERVLEQTDLTLYEPNTTLQGYDWYQRRPTLESAVFEAVLDGTAYALDDYPLPDNQAEIPRRPERIACILTLRHPDGRPETRRLPTDLAFINRSPGKTLYYGNYPLVAAGSNVTPDELVELLRHVFYYYNDDYDADGPETQDGDFRSVARQIALHTLKGPEDASRARLVDAVYDHLWYLRPKDTPCVVLRIYANHVGVEFTQDTRDCPTA